MIMKNNPQTSLPPGFRFHPTDEELLLHYLRKKVVSIPLPVSIIAEVDIYKFDPWELPARAAFGEKEWYFFSPRDRKYPNGARPNRAAASGYWKATGTDKTIVASSTTLAAAGQQHIGVKKALVFYKGKPPKGVKTNWIMHEYRLADALNLSYNNNNQSTKLRDSSMRLDDWVLCRIYKKSSGLIPTETTAAAEVAVACDQDRDEEEQEKESFIQDIFLPGLRNTSTHNHNTLYKQKSTSFSNLLDAMDYSMLSSFLADTAGFESPNLFMNSGFQAQDQTYLNNSINSSPQLNSTVPVIENRSLKREHFGEDLVYPSKKLINSCSFTKGANQTDIQQNNLSNQYSIFNHQQILMNPHLQIKGLNEGF